MRITTLTILFIMCSHLLLFIPEAWGATSFIPGHVIVKFSPSSDWNQVVTTASQMDPPDFTQFKPIISSLESQLNALLKPTKIFGDQRVLFSIDVEYLTNRLQTKLDHHLSVLSATEESLPAIDNMTPVIDKHRVVFAPGSKEFTATASQNLPTNDSQRLTLLLNSLKHDLQLPLSGQPSQPGEVILWIDLPEFTQSLVDQLQSLTQIESAQLNYVLSYQ